MILWQGFRKRKWCGAQKREGYEITEQYPLGSAAPRLEGRQEKRRPANRTAFKFTVS